MENSTGLIDQDALVANETDPVTDLEEPENIANTDGSECRVGIESIPNSANHYRLGIIFLKHFYTALDYENNLVAMGLNSAAMEKEITIIRDPEGKLQNYVGPQDDYHTLVTLLVFLLFGLFCWFYVISIQYERKKKPGYVPLVLRNGFMQRF